MYATNITIIVGVFLSLLASDSVRAAEINGKVESVDGKTIQLVVDGEWLPVVGDPCEIFVDLPGVGRARVGVATVSKVEGNAIFASVIRSTATVSAGQLAAINSPSPVRRTGMQVPLLIGRPAADARTEVERAGFKAVFEVGIPAPSGVPPFTAYAQKPVAGGTLGKGQEVVITIYGDSNSDSTAPPAPTAPTTARSTTPRTTARNALALDTPNIKGPDANSSAIVRLVASLMEQHHISAHPLDDEISRRTFENLIDNLDPQRMYFYQSDINDFKQDRYNIDDWIHDGDIDFYYRMFRRFLVRVDERVRGLADILALEPDFTLDEELVIDTESLAFPRDAVQSREGWRKRIKYDLLKETVGGTDLDEARHKVQVRYTNYLNLLKQNSDDDLLEFVLNQFTHAYDPHSNYISKQTWQNFVIQNEQQMTGIGASLKIFDGDVQVMKIIFGSPSYQHGQLKAGDRIIAVGQGASGELVDVRGKPLAGVVQLIRGKPDTIVRLKVVPKGKFEVKVYAITRKKFDLQKAQATILLGDQLPEGRHAKLGFIYLPGFYRDWQPKDDAQELSLSAARDVRKILMDFQSEQVDLIVLDLRNNTGGSLNECIDITGFFVGKGNVLQVKGRDGKVETYAGNDTPILSEKPVVALTSSLTSSGAEILAGALQDYRRALVIGDESTHGSGVVANLQDLGAMLFKTKTPVDYGRLKLVMQRFYRPSGDSTQLRGVHADIVLPALTCVTVEREETLKHTLEFDQIAPADFVPMNYGIDETLVNALQSRSETRQAASAFFKDLNQKIATYRDLKNRTAISLNRAAYISSQRTFDSDDQQLPSLAGVPDVIHDGYLNESLSISLDYLARHQVFAGRSQLQGRPTFDGDCKVQSSGDGRS